jgi:hypothetical protein
MLVLVIETMVELGLSDCLAEGAVTSAACNFGYRWFGRENNDGWK